MPIRKMTTQIQTGEWHAILDALVMGPESTPADVIEKIELLQSLLADARKAKSHPTFGNSSL